MQGQGLAYYVDVVMCIDATGSMSPVIEEVKRNALSFHANMTDRLEDSGREVDQLRIKVIAFRDYGCDSEPMVQSEFFKLPEENSAFEAFVNGIEASGGGDGPENALEAIALALKSDWTTGGDKRRHIVLMFTDAPALPLGERAGSASYPAGMPRDLAQLGAWWHGTDQSLSSTYQIDAGRLVAFVPNAEPWSELTAWNRYWPAFSAAGTGLSEVDMEAVYDLIVSSFIRTEQ